MHNYNMQSAQNYSKVLYDAHHSEIPLAVTMELTSKCNWRCKHCYLPNHNIKGMTTNKIKSILKQLRSLGTFKITFTGGELLTRKDALDIIAFAKSLHFQVNILSNASLVTPEIAQKLKKLYINFFH